MRRYKWFILGLVIIFSFVAFVPVIAVSWGEKIDWQSFANAYLDDPVHFYVDTFQDVDDINIGDGSCNTSSSTCSLRAAVHEANMLTSLRADVIIHLPAGEYPLMLSDTGFHLFTNRFSTWPIVIQGEGAEATIIQGNQTAGLFDLRYSATFRDVTLRGGNGGTENPGAINVHDASELIMVNSIVRDNYGDGGAIKLFGPSSYVTLDKVSLLNNTSGSNGGAIQNLGGHLFIKFSLISGNSAPDIGGAIFGTRPLGRLSLINSTVSGNSSWNGSAIAIIVLDPHQLTSGISITESTVSDNYTSSSGGAAIFADYYVSLTLSSSIVSGNTGDNSFNCSNHILNSFSEYSISTSDCLPDSYMDNLVDVDPQLGPLQDNGGNTLTHALQPGSPAINNGFGSDRCIFGLSGPLAFDQRGFPRPSGPFDPRCDIGAYEFDDWLFVYLPLITR